MTLSNDGLVDLQVSELATSHPTYTVGVSLPAFVAAGADLTIPVRFDPIDTLPVSATLQVTIGAVGLPRVSLRAND